MLNSLTYDQTKLSDEEAKHYKRRLKQRIRNIEDVIDIHLNKIGALEKYMDKTYLYKLALLQLNQEKVQKPKDKGEKKVLRMVDVTQSYCIYDSLDYMFAQNMKHRVDKEIMDLQFLQNEPPPVYC